MKLKLFRLPDDWAEEIQRLADEAKEPFTRTALKLLRPQLEQERRKNRKDEPAPLSRIPKRGVQPKQDTT